MKRPTDGYNAERAIEAWLRRRCRLPLSQDHAALSVSIALGMSKPMSRQSIDNYEKCAMFKLGVAMRRELGDEIPWRGNVAVKQHRR